MISKDLNCAIDQAEALMSSGEFTPRSWRQFIACLHDLAAQAEEMETHTKPFGKEARHDSHSRFENCGDTPASLADSLRRPSASDQAQIGALAGQG